jgi:cysteine desulfurase
MLPFSTGSFGNPHSRTHAFGWEAETAVEIGQYIILGSLVHSPP